MTDPATTTLTVRSPQGGDLEVLVFEVLRRNTGVLFDLLGVVFRHLVRTEGDHPADEHDPASPDPPPTATHHSRSWHSPSSEHGETSIQDHTRMRGPGTDSSSAAAGDRAGVVPRASL